MTLIARSYFDTSLFPESARIKQWSDAATPVWDILSVDDDTFGAVVDLYHGGNLVFGTVGSSAQTTAREMARIAEDGIDYYAFNSTCRASAAPWRAAMKSSCTRATCSPSI